VNIFLHKFRLVYCPQKKLSPDKDMIPWQGSSTFRTYNPRKINEVWSVSVNGVFCVCMKHCHIFV